MDKSDTGNTVLFFETYSIFQVLFLFKHIRKACVIYFHKRSLPHLKHNLRTKKIEETLIRLLNKHVKIETIPSEKINTHNWILNKRSVKFVEDLTDDIKNSSIYKTILKIIRDDNILKYYKAQIVDDISARLLFFRMAKDLIENYKDCVYLIPAYIDNSRIQKELFNKGTLNPYIMPGSFVANKIRNLFNKAYKLIVLLLLPSAYVILNLKKINLKRINKKKYDIMMPVIYGFHENDVIVNGVKRVQDDSYLYNENIALGRIIHIFNYWRYPTEIEKSYKNIMKKRGIPYMDSADYKINANLLILIMKVQLKIIKHFLIKLFFWHDRYEYINYSNRIIYWMIKKYLEFENVDYKVELIRHDYSVNHIIETILCNHHNKKTVGMQHTVLPCSLPNLCYVHMDKHIVYGDIFVKKFFPYWQQIRLAKTGRENIDWVVNILNDAVKMTQLKDKIRSKYPERKYTVLITFPSGDEKNLRKQWNEMYNALYNLRDIDLDFNLFLRFRGEGHLYIYKHLQRFRDLPEIDERIHIDHKNFTTYELMTLSDLFIANSASFGISEAIVTKAKVFTFDYMDIAKFFFPDYGTDFILYNRKDILKVFKGLENNFQDFDCKWDLLKKDCNYYYDGNNLKRIQEVVLDTLKEVKS